METRHRGAPFATLAFAQQLILQTVHHCVAARCRRWSILFISSTRRPRSIVSAPQPNLRCSIRIWFRARKQGSFTCNSCFCSKAKFANYPSLLPGSKPELVDYSKSRLSYSIVSRLTRNLKVACSLHLNQLWYRDLKHRHRSCDSCYCSKANFANSMFFVSRLEA